MSGGFCWNCLHPVSVHGYDQGCLAGLHAAAGSLLSLTGCSCALEPDNAAVPPSEPVVDAPQDAPKPQTHVPARERSKPVSWATVGANKARAKARKEREQ